MNETKPDNAETRERILLAAEHLFAEQGYDSTSIRDITAEAECNVAAVNYHFGGKDKLYVETFRRLLVDLRDRRISSMRRDMSDVTDPTLEYFLESFANSFLEPLVDGSRGRLDPEIRSVYRSIGLQYRDRVASASGCFGYRQQVCRQSQ